MNAETFKQTILPHYALMTGVATRLLGSRDNGADAVQDVIVTLWQQRDRLDSQRNIAAFCITAVRNRCISILRHNSFTVSDMEQTPAEAPSSVSADSSVQCRELREAIAALPEPQRSVITLSARGFSNAEIAGQTGLSEGNVRQIVSRVRRRLRQAFAES